MIEIRAVNLRWYLESGVVQRIFFSKTDLLTRGNLFTDSLATLGVELVSTNKYFLKIHS